MEIEEELLERGINKLYSFGSVNLGKVRVIGKGKTGIVTLYDKDKVIKIRRSDSPKETLEVEAKIQILAYPTSPKVYEYGRNYIIMDYIIGRKLTRNEDINIIIDLLNRAYHLEKVKIEHKELSRPWKNVIVSYDRTYILDYDSASIKERALNVQKILSALGYYEMAKQYSKGSLNLDEVIKLLKSQY
jgi:putative serine/threonine protein kinase